jgi:hypothetical protein
VLAEDAEKHLESKCTITSLSLQTIMEQSVATPLNDAEKKIGDYTVRRMVAGSTKPLTISTGGRVSINAQCTERIIACKL